MPVQDTPDAFASFKRFMRSEPHSKQIDDAGFVKLSDLWNRAKTPE
jgi:hypothetical protein